MKYFTLDWWNGIQELEGQDPLDTYDAYVKEYAGQIPEAYMKLYNEIYIHDGELREVDLDIKNRLLHLLIYAGDDKGSLREVIIKYLGVTSYKSISDAKKGLPGTFGYGDLGYHEIEVMESEFEHRMLFSSGIELQVQFESMQLKYT
ncbi:hypothetical protein [Hahella ganghwensis]|uniref:hypothetical protein n=1 Tax=Hahella ganghwensis TaxID=286420 RepID=UPI0003660E9D|nr:hypothetical protein [Hahella ganghwensis]